MDKLKTESPNLTEQNIENIGKLFPNALTEMKDEEGKLKKGINFEVLKQELSGDVVDGEECYDFTWVGKKAAIVEANTPIRKTLRPCFEESKGWETTENLYIEGDNLDVLKLLQESYLNSIKMIYIDPPYNTGNEFIFNDTYTIDKDKYDEGTGFYDDNGNILFQKNEISNPRFHSDWCSMIFSRLKLAKTLLSDKGIIFISIDDNEIDNLKKICNEIFGESNFIACISRATGTPTGGGNKAIVNELDYILAYAKAAVFATIEGLPMTVEDSKIYDLEDEYGRYLIRPLRRTGGEDRREDRPTMFYGLGAPNGTIVFPYGPTGYESRWICGKAKYEELLEDNKILWKEMKKNGEDSWQVYQKFYLENRKKQPSNLWTKIEGNKKATRDCRKLFNDVKVFDFPKPVELIKNLLKMVAVDNDGFILDFFSGSATTAHAVMQLNAEDGGNRKFIMVQLPELTNENSEAYKEGYKNISEIGKERIRRAGEKIKQDNQGKEGIEKLDIGFRVLKVDSTNMKDVYYAANEYNQQMLSGLESNIKEDRADLDLLYGVLLDWGLPLSLKHDIEEIDGVTVHTVDQGSLIACFADHVPENVVREIAKRQPLRAVFRDSSFASSPEKINVEEIFKLLSPNTSVRVI